MLFPRCRLAFAFVLLALVPITRAQLTTQIVASGLDRPIFVTHAPGDESALFVIEQEGQIRIIRDGVLRPQPFLDIDSIVVGGTSGGDERGLLGLAFSPDYATSGKFYVNYTGINAGSLATFVVEFTAVDENTADPGSGRVIIAIAQPEFNHNAGWIGFGPHDGMLYIFNGDGGGANDPDQNGQDLGTLLGSILRLDVSDDSVPYTIPADNPFVGQAGALDEIYAYGVRNPWRGSFAPNGDLYFGDVGQSRREELNLLPAGTGGQNYGWRCREGFIATPGINCANDPTWVDPIYDNSRPFGECSIVGGYVYTGCALGEDYQDLYFFTDYCTGRVQTRNNATGVVNPTPEFDLGFGLASFGEGPDGELYVCMIFSGQVRRIVNTGGDQCPCPGDLADTSGFGAPDGMIDFGDFFALSFLAGSCGAGTTNPDCNGDLSDTSGFGAPDGMIDFGDFFALSFLAGPCP